MAFESIRAQALRAILTMLIIAIGITALVGILTSADAIESSISGNFTQLGANTFTIQNRGPSIRINNKGEKWQSFPEITQKQAEEFKERFQYSGAQASISYIATGRPAAGGIGGPLRPGPGCQGVVAAYRAPLRVSRGRLGLQAQALAFGHRGLSVGRAVGARRSAQGSARG